MKKKALIKIKNFGGGELFDYFIKNNQFILVCNKASVMAYQRFLGNRNLNTNFICVRISKNQYFRSEFYLTTKKWIMPTIHLCAFYSSTDLNIFLENSNNQNSFCLVLLNTVFLNKNSLFSYSTNTHTLFNSMIFHFFFIIFVLCNIIKMNLSFLKLGVFFKLNS